MRPGDGDDLVEVEFLDGPGNAADADEQLDVTRSARSSLRRRVFTLGAVAVLAAALVVRTATSHDSAHVAAPPTATPTQATPAPTGAEPNVSVLTARTGWVQIPSVPANVCPSGGCIIGPDLPGSFVAAVRARLHIATPKQQVEVTGVTSDRVMYRRLTAAGPDRTAVSVTVVKESGRVAATSVVKLTSTTVTGSVSSPVTGVGFLVTVVVTGPSGWAPPIAAMHALAEDSRLLVAG